MGGSSGCHGEEEIFKNTQAVDKCEEKKILGRTNSTWKNNSVREVVCG
jgi:hypothetical protein